jgi:hypothetical protein
LPVNGGREIGKNNNRDSVTYIGLGILFKTNETVVTRMEDRAEKSREEDKAKECDKRPN